jgi:hypothetical protein
LKTLQQIRVCSFKFKHFFLLHVLPIWICVLRGILEHRIFFRTCFSDSLPDMWDFILIARVWSPNGLSWSNLTHGTWYFYGTWYMVFLFYMVIGT